MQTSAFAVSKLLTSLLDRPVQAAQCTDVTFTPQIRFATYQYEPDQSTMLVKIDLRTLACLAGLLIGLPTSQADAMAAKGNLDENMTDAAREIMNIFSSAVVSEGRAIFQDLYATEAQLPAEAKALQRLSSLSRSLFRCSVSGNPIGSLSILLPY